jgi:predicted secreted acid phosphatase
MHLPPKGKKFDELVVCDLDGTLADNRHRRHLVPAPGEYRDWTPYSKACVDDTPIEGVISLINLLWNHYSIFLLSNRESSAIDETRWWLSRHGVMYDFLRLREPEDIEGSSEYKVKAIDRIKDDGYKVHLLIDDLPSTFTQVRAAGTPVVCVNPLYCDISVPGKNLK